MDPRTAPRSRRERPAKPALSRAVIVAAAMEITRAEGLPKVTMRRLARALDTGPASLYVYVANTAALHAAILDEFLGTVEAPAEGEWHERLEGLLGAYTAVLLAHPGLAASALVARPGGPRYLALLETLLRLLDEGGVSGGRAAWGVDALLLHATATAAEHAGRDGAEADADQDDWDALTRAVGAVDGRTHPRIAALGSALMSGTPHERLAWGFRTLINGIAHTPVPIEPVPTEPVPTEPVPTETPGAAS
ncbi:TetR/AcrR family transcriptional regulator [Streptomyces corynorhini]|uniref:TetR/AcrR family transcriptional regulator n=1 Tax=Streptomyces corynorhini TaxID=2282652 RepID=A0A370B716_9ACTN|nr:TetR/AcrR family transcriptional regulator [Streptomyces corynorhini]RDG37391.1 TetR/AcrR family transcriptional regulator [Streptomyces corynorhini]